MASSRTLLILSLLLLICGGITFVNSESEPEDPNDTDNDGIDTENEDTDDDADDSDDLFVDLTHEMEKDIPKYPGVKGLRMNTTFKGKTKDGHWYQSEEVSMGTHLSTHLDAPIHYFREGWTVSDIPFDCLSERPTVVIDLRSKVFLPKEVVPETQLTREDLLAFEEEHGQIPNDSVVLVLTGWGRYWANRAEYLGTEEENDDHHRHPGVSLEAAKWLTSERDISIDYGQTGAPVAHVELASHNKYVLENVAYMEKLPATGAILNVGVMKIGGDVSGAPVRLMARLPDPNDSDDDDDDDDDSASSNALSLQLLFFSLLVIVIQRRVRQ